MEILSLEHAAVNVSNLERSKRFYGEGLGLKEIARPDFDFHGAWYGIGENQQLHLLEEKDLVRLDHRQNHHFALQVKDIDATKKALEDRGVRIVMGPMERPDGVTQIFIMDPDGYLIELSNP